MVQPRDDQLVEKLVPDFVTRGEGIPIWKLVDLGNFFDPDDLLLTLRFDDHRLLDPGTLGNYFVGTHGEQVLNSPVNAAAGSRGNLTLVPSIWPALPAVKTNLAATNEIIAPSFELWTAGAPDSWTIYQTPTTTQDNAIVYTGSSALHIVTNHAGDTEGWYIDVAGLTPAATYTIGMWIYGISGTCRFFVSDGGGIANPVISSTVSHYGRWERLSVQKVCPGSGSIRVWAANFDIGNHEMVFDGAGLYAGSTDPGHVDGDMGDGYSWTGTPHATTSTRVANHLDLDNHVSLIDGNNTVSFALWVQAPYDYDVTWPGAGVNNPVFDARGANDNNRIFLIYDATDNRFEVYINGAYRLFGTGFVFEAGDWLHIIVTVDFTNDDYNLYINGILLDNVTPALTAPTLTSWRIGAFFNGSASVGFVFAESVTIDRVLTDVEVANLYAMRRPIIDPDAIDKQLNVGIVVYYNANQSINDSTWTLVLLNTVEYNEHLVFDTVAHRVYITQPGWYQLGFVTNWGLGNGSILCRIDVNGVVIAYGANYTAAGVGGRPHCDRLKYLVPGDYVEAYVWQNSGGAANLFYQIANSPYLQVVKIRNVFEGSY